MNSWLSITRYKMDKKFWTGKNVFVTGADGFIGGWLAKGLVDAGAKVTVIIRDLKRQNALDFHSIREKTTIVVGDIADYSVISRALNEYEIDTVFHLAAQAIVGTANRSPVSTFESNIKGSWTILEACRVTSTVKRVIVASSDKAYGNQEKLPYTEDQPLKGLYPYDASKVCTDVLAQSYHTSYGLPVCITRNANTYGGADANMSRIVPDTICSALLGKELVIRSDGTLERDYMYVQDAVDAYLTLGENMHRDDIVGEAFNFGVGEPVTVLELFNTIIKLTGSEMKPKILDQAKNEIKRQYLNVDKVKSMLSWKPKYTLESGLKETISWYEEYLKEKGDL
jgi:CDP-glucose 4,6-dehydratase